MKKIILLAAFCTGLYVTVNAQDKKVANSDQQSAATLETVAKQETDRLDKIVSLTADQKEAIQRVNISIARRMEIVNKNASADDRARATTELHNAQVNMWMQHLTVDQQVKYKNSIGK